MTRSATVHEFWHATGLGQRVPDIFSARPVSAADLGTCRIRRKPILNGLINEYERAA